MGRLRLALLVAVVAAVGHDATYAIGHGPGELGAALHDTGHDGYWLPVVLGVLAAAGVCVALTAWRWRYLRRQLRAVGWRAARRRAGSAPWLRILALAARLCLAALTIFVLQENAEHGAANGGHLPGLGVLAGHGYAATLPAFIGVSLLIAAMTHLMVGGVRQLEVELALARASLPRPQSRSGSRPARTPARRPSSPGAQPDLGRAPPVAVLTPV